MKTAQQAYEESLRNNFSDISSIMEIAEKQIDECTKLGCFATLIGSFNPIAAEKAAIELEKLGYNSLVLGSGRFDGHGNPICNIAVNWKNLPSNTRESYD